MDPGEPPDDGMIADRNMTSQTRRIRKNEMAAEMTVMGNVHIGHQEILRPNGGCPTALYRRPVDCHIFPENVVVADDHLGLFAVVIQMLRRGADRDKWMQLAPCTDLRPAINRDMRHEMGSRSNRDMLTDQTKRPELHIIGKTGLWVHYSCCMNLHSEPPVDVIVIRYSRFVN